MSPVAIVIGLALVLLVAGLLLARWSGSMKYPLLVSIVFWVGVILVVCGLILLVTPPLILLNNLLRAMLGQPQFLFPG